MRQDWILTSGHKEGISKQAPKTKSSIPTLIIIPWASPLKYGNRNVGEIVSSKYRYRIFISTLGHVAEYRNYRDTLVLKNKGNLRNSRGNSYSKKMVSRILNYGKINSEFWIWNFSCVPWHRVIAHPLEVLSHI